MRPIGDDALANKANELERYLVQMGVKVQLLNRLKSIHGSYDDIIEIDIDLESHLRLLASDHNPGKFELIGVSRLVEKKQLASTVWQALEGLSRIDILLPERHIQDNQHTSN